MTQEYFDDFPVMPTIRELILDGFARGGEKRQFVFTDENRQVTEKRFCDVYRDVRDFGAFLRTRGIVEGDKLAILMENSYFWNVVYYAAQVNGCVTVALDAALPARDLYDQLADCGCRALVCTPKQREKLGEIPENAAPAEIFLSSDADALLAAGRAAPEALDAFLASTVSPEALASIVYTSGTTGKVKGVMLSNKNVCSNVYAVMHVTPESHGIGFLPLNHTYAWVSGLFATLVRGQWGYICTDLKRIYRDIRDYKPVQFAAVPMVVEMIHQNIVLTAKRNGTYDKLMQGITMSRNFMLSGYDARREIFSEIHEFLGGELECIFCGGAYLSPEIERFMFDVGIQIITGYGLTECAPCVTCSRRYAYKFGSVGLPLECCEVKIREPDADGVGEICVKGDNVFMGYYGDPEATASVFDGDWLRTGDRGYIDEDGFLFFTGREKNLIILSNGKNVSPEQIETRLCEQIPFVREVVVSERGNRIHAEFYLNEDDEPDARDRLPDAVARANETLAEYMQVQTFAVRDEPFPKTATLKIKRQ